MSVAGEDAFFVGEEGVVWCCAAVREGALPLDAPVVFPPSLEFGEPRGPDCPEGREEPFDAGDDGSWKPPRVEEVPEEFVDVVVWAFVVVGGDCRGGREAKVDDEDVGRGGVYEEISGVEVVVDNLQRTTGSAQKQAKSYERQHLPPFRGFWRQRRRG